MFKWDGTDVTNIISQSYIYSAEHGKYKYWVIRHVCNNTIHEETCIVRSCKDSLSSLIDELKPIFGLQKLGTHWCRYNGKMKLLIKAVRTPKGEIKQEITLNQIDPSTNHLLKFRVQEIFAFRELLGVTRSYSSSIIIRESKNSVYPISFYEPGMVTTDKKIIPYKILETWFEGSSIDIVVKKLCKIHTIDRLGVVLHNIRGKIEETIERVDRRAISYKTCIMNRITERLQTTLSE